VFRDHEPNCEMRIFTGSANCTCGASEFNTKAFADAEGSAKADAGGSVTPRMLQATFMLVIEGLRKDVETLLASGLTVKEVAAIIVERAQEK
jgi:hypothetical protein